MKKYTFLLIVLFFYACKKDTILIPNNVPYNGKYISTIQIENYINKLFIDLIGREPLNTEMASEVQNLKDADLSEEARITLITKLQSNTDFLEGDTSYQQAYYHRFYDVVKIRMLEGIENDVMNEKKGNLINAYNGAVASGDSLTAAIRLRDINEINNVFAIEIDYKEKTIDISEVFQRLLDNYVYDEINMNTFNFINASFEDLLFRYPTVQEYNTAYDMIEDNQSGYLFGQTGASKGDYLEILTDSREFYEGLITWTYKSLVIRDPKPSEIATYLPELMTTKDFQNLQLQIMKTDEFASFE